MCQVGYLPELYEDARSEKYKIRRSVDRFVMYAKETQTKPLASLAFHTAVQVDCSVSLGSTWRVSVMVSIHYAYRKGDVKSF